MTTLARLKTSVDSWLTRDDVAVSGSDFPEILLIAESCLARKLRLIVQEVTTTLVFTGREADLPADFLEQRMPFIDDTFRKFEYMTPQAIREHSGWISGRAASYYTLEGSADTDGADDRVKMVISGPASAENPLSVDVNYWRRFPALTNDADTNWLMVNHYDIYLYACLRAACEYIQEHELEDRYAAKFDKYTEDQNKLENRKRYGATPKRSSNSPRSII